MRGQVRGAGEGAGEGGDMQRRDVDKRHANRRKSKSQTSTEEDAVLLPAALRLQSVSFSIKVCCTSTGESWRVSVQLKCLLTEL